MVMEEFANIKQDLQRKKSQREMVRRKLRETKAEIRELQRKREVGEKARAVIQIVAQQTQQNLEYHISNLVTTALRAIWNEPLEFIAKIVMRRNKTECDLLIKEGGNEPTPLPETRGGGVLDVASFALRIAYWSLRKNRPVFILDEPFKFVSPDRQREVSDMLKMLSEELGLQIIMVSHADDINYNADRTFAVKRGESGRSVCQEQV